MFAEGADTEQIIKKIDTFENDFREKIKSRRKQFVSELRKFCQRNPDSDLKAITGFVEQKLQNYAVNIIKAAMAAEEREKVVA